MSKYRRKPSGWLLYNSMGFPDFLFTILTYSMILLVFVTMMWVIFGLLAYLNDDLAKAPVIIQVMESLRTGLVALAATVFGLAGSYTVRRFKKDDHYIEKKRLDSDLKKPTGWETPPITQEGLTLVMDEEDI